MLHGRAGRSKVKQEPSSAQPQPKPAGALPATVDEKVREVANTQQSVVNSKQHHSSTAARADASHTNEPTATAAAEADTPFPAGASDTGIKDEEGVLQEEADGSGVFAADADSKTAAQAPPHDHTGGVSSAAIPAASCEDGQAVINDYGGTSAGRADVDTKQNHQAQVQPSAHESGVLQDEGPEGSRAQEANEAGLQAMSHGQDGPSAALKTEPQDSDAELLQGAAIAEAAAGVGDQDEAAARTAGEIPCMTCPV